MPDPGPRQLRLRTLTLTMAILAFATMLQAQSDRQSELPASEANVHQLRRQLDGMQQKRQDARNKPVFSWEQNPRPLELSHAQRPGRDHAVLELHYAAREIPCFVRLTPADKSGHSAIHAPMLVRASQWIKLPKGEWRIEILAGYVTGPIIALPEAIVAVDGGKVYRLTFGPDEEILARDLAREASARVRKAGRLPRVRVAPSP
jgi:hypothetical protein